MNKEEVIDLVKDAGFGFLATMEKNQPRVRPMMPHITEEGVLLLALLPRSRTIPQIKENPLVEICYVDRKMSYCRIAGKAKISDNTENKEIVWNNVPMLRQYFSGPQDPNFILVEIETMDAEVMTPQQTKPTSISLKE